MRVRLMFTELHRVAVDESLVLPCGCLCRVTGEVTQPSGDAVLDIVQGCCWHRAEKKTVQWLGSVVFVGGPVSDRASQGRETP